MSKETNNKKFKIINLELAEKALIAIGDFLIKEATDWIKFILSEDEDEDEDTNKRK